jgi:hypothetical protein
MGGTSRQIMVSVPAGHPPDGKRRVPAPDSEKEDQILIANTDGTGERLSSTELCAPGRGTDPAYPLTQLIAWCFFGVGKNQITSLLIHAEGKLIKDFPLATFVASCVPSTHRFDSSAGEVDRLAVADLASHPAGERVKITNDLQCLSLSRVSSVGKSLIYTRQHMPLQHLCGDSPSILIRSIGS